MLKPEISQVYAKFGLWTVRARYHHKDELLAKQRGRGLKWVSATGHTLLQNTNASINHDFNLQCYYWDTLKDIYSTFLTVLVRLQ